MEKYVQELSELSAEFRNYVQNLQKLADQVVKLGSRIEKISGEYGIPGPRLDEFRKCINNVKFPGTNVVRSNLPNIIPFPKTYQAVNYRTEFSAPINKLAVQSPFLATPGNTLPASIPDFRSALQRDGLILLAWDKRVTELGYRFTAYWVTSVDVPRFYSSRPLAEEEFHSARPFRKSYAAEDGIDFYGQDAPVYMVHVAPELMKNNPRHGELREDHINVLKNQGSDIDFDYKYLLKNENNRNPPKKKRRNSSPHPVGA